METTMSLVYYSFRDDVTTSQLGGYLDELAQFVSQAPLCLPLNPQRISDTCASRIREVDQDSFINAVASITEILFDCGYEHAVGIFLCDLHHRIAKLAIQANRHALWGAAYDGIAFVYGEMGRYVVWHETLHLFGADDCYELPNEGPTCNLTNCIMQYAPTTTRVGNWPFLCEENISRVRGSGSSEVQVDNAEPGAAPDPGSI